MTTEKWKREFANRVLRRLGELDMSQKKLAILTNIDRTIISKYLNCTRRVTIYDVINIARALDVPVDWLVNFGEYIEVEV